MGGGASAYDLLDPCFEWHARSVTWVYRSLKWMRPTLRPKYFGTDMRALAKAQMLGTPLTKMNRQINLDLRARYKKAGLDELLPEHAFDFGNQQFIAGRRRMIENFASIARHRSEIVRIESNTVRLASGAACDADLVLWGTGYETDLRYLEVDALSQLTRLEAIGCCCGDHFFLLDAPNLLFLRREFSRNERFDTMGVRPRREVHYVTYPRQGGFRSGAGLHERKLLRTRPLSRKARPRQLSRHALVSEISEFRVSPAARQADANSQRSV